MNSGQTIRLRQLTAGLSSGCGTHTGFHNRSWLWLSSWAPRGRPWAAFPIRSETGTQWGCRPSAERSGTGLFCPPVKQTVTSFDTKLIVKGWERWTGQTWCRFKRKHSSGTNTWNTSGSNQCAQQCFWLRPQTVWLLRLQPLLMSQILIFFRYKMF